MTELLQTLILLLGATTCHSVLYTALNISGTPEDAEINPPTPCPPLTIQKTSISVPSVLTEVHSFPSKSKNTAVVLKFFKVETSCTVGFFGSEWRNYISKSPSHVSKVDSRLVESSISKSKISLGTGVSVGSSRLTSTPEEFDCTWMQTNRKSYDLVDIEEINIRWNIKGETHLEGKTLCSIHDPNGICQSQDNYILIFTPHTESTVCDSENIITSNCTLEYHDSSTMMANCLNPHRIDYFDTNSMLHKMTCNGKEIEFIQSKSHMTYYYVTGEKDPVRQYISMNGKKRARRSDPGNFQEEIEIDHIRLQEEQEMTQVLADISGLSEYAYNALSKLRRETCLIRYSLLKSLYRSGNLQSYMELLIGDQTAEIKILSNRRASIYYYNKMTISDITLLRSCKEGMYIEFSIGGIRKRGVFQNSTGIPFPKCTPINSEATYYLPGLDGKERNIQSGQTVIDDLSPPEIDPFIQIEEDSNTSFLDGIIDDMSDSTKKSLESWRWSDLLPNFDFGVFNSMKWLGVAIILYTGYKIFKSRRPSSRWGGN